MKYYLQNVLKLCCFYGKIAGMTEFWRFFHSARSSAIPSVEMTKERVSARLQLVINKYSTLVRELFETCSGWLRQRFGSASTRSRRLPEAHPKNSRRNTEENNTQVQSIFEKQATPGARLDRPSAKAPSQQKTIVNYKSNATDVQYSNLHNERPLRFGEGSVSTRPGVGSGDSTDLGADSFGTRCQLLRETAHQVRHQLRLNRLRRERTGRREGKAIFDAYRFLHYGRNDAIHRLKTIRERVLRALKPYSIYLTALNVLFCVCLAHARQSSSPEAAYGVALSTDSIKPLQIGDVIPEALWNLPFQMVKAGQEGSKTVTLNDYKGKLIILDFWATSCGSCVAAMPKYQQLQDQFEQDLFLLPVTYETAGQVDRLITNNRFMRRVSLPMALGNRSLAAYFPHNLLPHIAWIGNDGRVWAVTSGDELNKHNVDKALSGIPFGNDSKIDALTFDEAKPILLENNTGDNTNFRYRSIISDHIAGLPGMSGKRRYKGAVRLFATNNNLLQLYQLVYPELYRIPRHRYRLKVTDSVYFLDPTNLPTSERATWLKNYTFCYELIIPYRTQCEAELVAKQDLDRFFNMESSVIKEKTKCLVLRASDKKHDKQAAPSDEPVFLQSVPYRELTDWLAENTGIPDIFLETSLPQESVLELPTGLSQWEEYNHFLNNYGLKMEAEERVLAYFILNDNNAWSENISR